MDETEDPNGEIGELEDDCADQVRCAHAQLVFFLKISNIFFENVFV